MVVFYCNPIKIVTNYNDQLFKEILCGYLALNFIQNNIHNTPETVETKITKVIEKIMIQTTANCSS